MKKSGSNEHSGARIWGAHKEGDAHEVFTDDAQIQAHRAATLRGPTPNAWSEVAIHWTGFEPFGAHPINPSWAVAQAAHQALRAMAHSGVTSAHTCLLVTYALAQSWHRAAVDEPDAGAARVWLHVGLAADRPEVCFERSAYNATGLTPDNDGHVGLTGTQGLAESGPSMLRTALDLEAMCAQWRALEVGVEAQVSDDPGRYVCNATYYHALQEVGRAREVGRAGAALFVHVPMLDGSGAERVGQALARVVMAALPHSKT